MLRNSSSRIARSFRVCQPSTATLTKTSLPALLTTSPSTPQRTLYRPFHTTYKKMASIYTSETPDEVKNAKGLHLLTMSTPNGQAVQILLEELKDVYGTEWTTTLVDIMTNDQKKDWFLRLNPNGRIPVIVDNTQSPPFASHETSAEMLYLVKAYDKQDKFGFKDDLERNECLQWVFFGHGSLAPYMGNLGWFKRQSEQVEMAINRFKNETHRVFGVVEIQLSGKYGEGPKEYLAGKGKGSYSVADIKNWCWIKNWERGGFAKEEMEKDFPHMLKWIDRIAERPAVKRGCGEEYNLQK